MKNDRLLRVLIAAGCVPGALCCTKKNQSEASSINGRSGNMEYAVVYHPDVKISQYNDTTIALRVVVKYVAGLPEPVTTGIGSYPRWARLDSVSSLPSTEIIDTTAFNVKTFNLRFHPFSSGTYPLTFVTKGASSDSQVHQVNIVVAPASDCSRYLVGQYTALQDCRPKKPYFKLETIYKSTKEGWIIIPGTGGGESYVDCQTKSIEMPSAPGAYDNLYGSGYFKDDSVFLHLIYINTNYKIYDTCDITMVRK